MGTEIIFMGIILPVLPTLSSRRIFGARVVPTRSSLARPGGAGIVRARVWLATRCGLGKSAPGKIKTYPFFAPRPFRNPNPEKRPLNKNKGNKETNPAMEKGRIEVGIHLF